MKQKETARAYDRIAVGEDREAHEGRDHADRERHHHHTHAAASHHDHGHHLLQVEHLSVSFQMYDESGSFFAAPRRRVPVIDDLSISVHAGEIIAVVGASGSGKTLLADSVMGLFEPNSEVSGDIWFDGVLQDAASLAALRGHGIALVPQSVSSLDPLMKVGKQVEGAGARCDRTRRRARRQALFARYGLSEEVAKVKADGTCTLQVGDQVEIIPNHSCSTANNTGWYTCVRGDEIVDFIAVDARENSKKKGTL